ncbi:MAG: hypothetical protein IJ837_00675 [Clostridia bacterium]|nr:hypothetical protein [Clostridia bacterium]
MNNCLAGFMLGLGLGVGLLCCPQVRDFVDKTSNKIKKKIKKLQEKTEE